MIVAYAQRAEGRQVGDGECFALADQALASVGARSAADYSDYIWGRPVSLAAARPGDIVQFRNFHIVRRVTTIARGEDGTLSTMQTQEMEERDHHTAIVTQNLGTSLVIAEQNMEPLGRIVQRSTIEIASGVKRDSSPTMDTTTETNVDGDVRIYRPQRLAPGAISAATQPGS
jgi:hypothetical protein